MSADKSEQCSVGKINGTECHKLSYTQQTNLVSITSLEQSEINILSLRSGVNLEQLISICEHHKAFFLNKFETYQKFCMDPFQSHNKKISKSLRVISLDFSQKINSLQNCVKSVPGQKICDVCRQKVNRSYTVLHDDVETNTSP